MTVLTAAVFLLAAVYANLPWSKAEASPLQKVDCWFRPPERFSIDCYQLLVPERRPDSLPQSVVTGSRNLLLPVVIVRAAAALSADDPVVYLAGGPGDGSWLDRDRITWWWDFIDDNAWLRSRDFILFDQRGSGLVEPRMDCRDAQALSLQLIQTIDAAQSIRLQREEAADCGKSLAEAGYDAAAYTSVDNAADLHDLFAALRIPQWNVYGLSYGTRLALEYMRRHPADIRSVILDSVLPPQAQFYEDDAANTDRAFQYLVAQCRADTDCRMFYPDLGSRLLNLVERLNRQPLAVTRPSPAGNGDITIRMDGNRLIYRFFNLLYNRDDIENLPRLIDAYDRGLRQEIAADLDNYIWEIYGRADFGDAMFLSVQCFEEEPFNDLAKADSAYAGYPLLRALTMGGESSTYGEICGAWRRAFGVAGERRSDTEAVKSDLPTLILTGSYDPVTPPAYARMAAATLPNSFLFEFAGFGHDVLGNNGCANEIAAAFLLQPGADPAQPCLDDETGPRFAEPAEPSL